MYQDRKDDINIKANAFKNQMLSLERDYKYVDEKLEYLQREPVVSMTLTLKTGRGFILRPVFDSNNQLLSKQRAEELQDITDKVTAATVRAVITFLEGQREIIIQKMNQLAKEKLK